MEMLIQWTYNLYKKCYNFGKFIYSDCERNRTENKNKKNKDTDEFICFFFVCECEYVVVNAR